MIIQTVVFRTENAPVISVTQEHAQDCPRRELVISGGKLAMAPSLYAFMAFGCLCFFYRIG